MKKSLSKETLINHCEYVAPEGFAAFPGNGISVLPQ